MDKHRLVLLTHQRQLALAQGGGGGPGLPRHGLEVAPAHLLDLWLLLLVVLPLPRLHCLHNLLLLTRPWDKVVWNGSSVAADHVLVQGKVRDETVADQFDKMNKKQQKERILVELVKHL